MSLNVMSATSITEHKQSKRWPKATASTLVAQCWTWTRQKKQSTECVEVSVLKKTMYFEFIGLIFSEWLLAFDKITLF